MRIAVITIIAGRRAHLERQHHGLAASTVLPDRYVVVAMGSPFVWEPALEPAPSILDIRAGDRLPLAAARNRGARAAMDDAADLLVFLDVDCIPTPALIENYARASVAHPAALLTGPVGYLPAQTDYERPQSYRPHFHDFRPMPADGEVAFGSHHLFWSLSFAATSATWKRIGGFHEGYAGYGGEDTDFGLLAEREGVALAWVGGAVAYHQWHPTEDPPVQHLDDIIANGSVFAERWGHWPMRGWLDDFESRGLVARDGATGSYRRSGARA